MARSSRKTKRQATRQAAPTPAPHAVTHAPAPHHPQPAHRSADWTGVHLWNIRFVRDLLWIILAAFVIWFGYELRSVFTPVLIALALAYLFHPLISRMERRHGWPRPVTIGAVLAVLSIVLLAFVLWLGPVLFAQLKQLVTAIPGYLDNLRARYDFDLGDFRKQLDEGVAEFQKNPSAYIAKVFQWLVAGTGSALDFIGGVLSSATYLLLALVLIPVYFFFFAWSFGPMVESFRKYIPQSRRERTLGVLAKMDAAVGSYFRDRVIISMIMAVMFAVGWGLLSVPYFLLLSLITGLLSLIPYAGFLGLFAALALKSLELLGGQPTGSDWAWGLGGIFVVVCVVQFIEGWILTPWIQGNSLNMSSVTILIVVFVGGAIGGVYGLILCIPIAACVKILAVEVLLPKLREWAAEN